MNPLQQLKSWLGPNATAIKALMASVSSYSPRGDFCSRLVTNASRESFGNERLAVSEDRC